MKTNRSFFIFLLFIFSEQVFAQGFADSPWPMIGRNPGHTYRGVSAPPATKVLKWKFRGEGYMGSPSIGADGTIYIGSNGGNVYNTKNGYIYAVNPDGSMKWKYTTGGSMLISVPAIGDNGTIYIGSQDSCLYALNLDGTLKWKYQTGYAVDSLPVIGYNGLIYFSSWDGFMYVLNSDGELQWKYKLPGLNSNFPAIGKDGTIYICGGDSYLYALNSDGTLKWRYEDVADMTSPSICEEDCAIYVGTTNRELAAFNMDGTLNWSLPIGNASIQASPAINENGTVYIGSEDFSLYAVGPNGTLKWSFPTNGHLYDAAAIGSDGCVYVQNVYNIYAINSDGTARWIFPNVEYGHSSPVIGSDGTLYFTSGHYLCALAPEKATAVESMTIPFTMEEPYPNPFNPSNTISFSLPAPAQANLTVYDITGRKVRILISGQLSAGSHSTVWDGKDAAGRSVSSGVYIARLESGKSAQSMKMLLMR